MDGQDAPAVTEIFWATYGTTTASEIQAALDAGKAVMCKYNDKLYASVVKTSTQFVFGATIGSTNYYTFINLSTDVWGASNKLVPSVLSTTTSTTPSETNVFSSLRTKNLIDAVDAKIASAVSLTFTYEDNTMQTYNLLTAPATQLNSLQLPSNEQEG